jgi:hypothetical protein
MPSSIPSSDRHRDTTADWRFKHGLRRSYSEWPITTCCLSCPSGHAQTFICFPSLLDCRSLAGAASDDLPRLLPLAIVSGSTYCIYAESHPTTDPTRHAPASKAPAPHSTRRTSVCENISIWHLFASFHYLAASCSPPQGPSTICHGSSHLRW